MLESLQRDLLRFGCDPERVDWARELPSWRAATFRKREVIFDRSGVADEVLFLCRGVAVAEALLEDDRTAVARFFEPGSFCMRPVSAVRRIPTTETVIAVTEVTGLVFPWSDLFRQYTEGAELGRYFRRHLLDTLLTDVEITTRRSRSDPEVNYAFFLERFPEAARVASQRLIAGYLGLTPEGFSRFLKRRRERLAAPPDEAPHED